MNPSAPPLLIDPEMAVAAAKLVFACIVIAFLVMAADRYEWRKPRKGPWDKK